MGKKKTKSKASKPAPAVQESTLTDMDLIAAAISTATQTVFMKVCRLCESKDGPFLNIFDADKVTAKKINEVMPFGIAENDDLPHKICFRCSAKVEELYEFVQKCIKTQQSLNTALGKKDQHVPKTKTRALWEEKLNKSNISNDDICNALIKKAMEGIKDIPLKQLEEEKSAGPKSVKKEAKIKTECPPTLKKESKNNTDVKNEPEDDKSLKQLKLTLDKCDQKFIPKRTSRSQNPEALLDGLPDARRQVKKCDKQNDDTKKNEQEVTSKSKSKKRAIQLSSSDEESSSSSDVEIKSPPPAQQTQKEEPKPENPPKPFNIMDHVSTIKVNGVGILFQCKLCNRNFLKKEVVMTHGCSKTGGVPKLDFLKTILPPDPPRAPVVKYINTKVDGELVKSSENEPAKTEIEVKKPEAKPKPRIGPASKVRRDENNPIIGMSVAPIEDPPAKPSSENSTSSPSVQFPSIPSLNSRYKLVPGPNNTYQLVEESFAGSVTDANDTSTKSSKKRKSDEPVKSTESKNRKTSSNSLNKSRTVVPEVIDLENSSEQTEKAENKSHEQPYPVGLFSTLPHHSSIYPPPPTPAPEPTFTTPAMKKQSYTIVQTGNPSKLLISTKPQPPQPVEETSRKRQRKTKHEIKEDGNEKRQPFNVTLEDAVRPKDAFFTFINVDPLLQPSYVLPTDNIIQESQISTSTPASKGNTDSKDKDKYSCNMCDERFSREKKLLAHIHSHYNKMDEEDMMREKNNRKRGKKF